MSGLSVMQTPLGPLSVLVSDGELVEIHWLEDAPMIPAEARLDPLAQEVQRQLGRYFERPGWRFDLPLAARGTGFQQRVWARLRQIPAGTTCTYGELARELGSGARALGNACRANPCPIVVPCHRVVAAQGIGGYDGHVGGRHLDIKRWLLAHEA